MDSSTSADPERAPRTVALASIADQTSAIDTLVSLAQSRIRVFDIDLQQTGWNASSRVEGLASFLRGSRGRRLDIIVHETRYIEASCARLLDLLRRYSHAMTIYRTGQEARHASDPLVLIDDAHYLHRFHYEQPRATLGLFQPDQVRPLVNRFDEIWATGEPGINATVLGL